jgi:plastocyanin
MRNRLLLLSVLLPFIAACSDGGSNTSSTPAATTPISTSVTAVATTGSSTAKDSAVGIANFKFTPAEVHVPVGGSVAWTNNDGQQHTATSAANFDAGAIQPGSTTTVAFATAGTFTYICSFHPFMTAKVIVG